MRYELRQIHVPRGIAVALSGISVLALCMSLAMPGFAFAAPAEEPIPVVPGNAAPEQFPAAQSCSCHSTLVAQWQESMHSKALSDPIFLAKVAEGDAATDGKIGPFCRKCHGPAAEMTGQSGSSSMTGGAADSIVCSFCHQVTGTTMPVGNVSHLVLPTNTFRAQLEDPQAPHAARYSAFHATSEICGGCHNVNHPVNGMHLEATYSEWQKSPQAKKGIQCQDCHMSEAPGKKIGPSPGKAAGMGPQREAIYQMNFVGVQVELGNAEAATALLKSAATVEMELPTVLETDSAEGTVTITNSGAGHYLPTGLTEVRQMWLTVVSTDKDGKETEIAKRVFGTVLRDAKGNYPAELWDATDIQSDDRIAPMESATVTFTAALPAGADAGTVVAKLQYKATGDELAKKSGTKNPTTTMAEATQAIYTSAEAKVAAEAKQTEPAASTDGLPTWVLMVSIMAAAVAVAGAAFLFLRKRG